MNLESNTALTALRPYLDEMETWNQEETPSSPQIVLSGMFSCKGISDSTLQCCTYV